MATWQIKNNKNEVVFEFKDGQTFVFEEARFRPRDWSKGLQHADLTERGFYVVKKADPPPAPPPPPPAPPPITKFSIDDERFRRTYETFVFNGVAYQLDPESQSKITAMGAHARFAILDGHLPGDYRWMDSDNDFAWIATDNSLILMDAPTVEAFSQAAAVWVARHSWAARTLKNMDPLPKDYKDDKYWP